MGEILERLVEEAQQPPPPPPPAAPAVAASLMGALSVNEPAAPLLSPSLLRRRRRRRSFKAGGAVAGPGDVQATAPGSSRTTLFIRAPLPLPGQVAPVGLGGAPRFYPVLKLGGAATAWLAGVSSSIPRRVSSCRVDRRPENPSVGSFFRLCVRKTHLLRSYERQASATLRTSLKP